MFPPTAHWASSGKRSDCRYSPSAGRTRLKTPEAQTWPISNDPYKWPVAGPQLYLPLRDGHGSIQSLTSRHCTFPWHDPPDCVPHRSEKDSPRFCHWKNVWAPHSGQTHNYNHQWPHPRIKPHPTETQRDKPDVCRHKPGCTPWSSGLLGWPDHKGLH